ncbi:putative UDP-N-acetylmuramoylalanyl-D-glutamate--2,6-diaminopimela te ligase domain protein, partial [Bacteroides fragilis str. 3986 N(B)19]
MKLKEILTSIQPVKITGNQDIEITGVDIDSRQVES